MSDSTISALSISGTSYEIQATKDIKNRDIASAIDVIEEVETVEEVILDELEGKELIAGNGINLNDTENGLEISLDNGISYMTSVDVSYPVTGDGTSDYPIGLDVYNYGGLSVTDDGLGLDSTVFNYSNGTWHFEGLAASATNAENAINAASATSAYRSLSATSATIAASVNNNSLTFKAKNFGNAVNWTTSNTLSFGKLATIEWDIGSGTYYMFSGSVTWDQYGKSQNGIFSISVSRSGTEISNYYLDGNDLKDGWNIHAVTRITDTKCYLDLYGVFEGAWAGIQLIVENGRVSAGNQGGNIKITYYNGESLTTTVPMGENGGTQTYSTSNGDLNYFRKRIPILASVFGKGKITASADLNSYGFNKTGTWTCADGATQKTITNNPWGTTTNGNFRLNVVVNTGNASSWWGHQECICPTYGAAPQKWVRSHSGGADSSNWGPWRKVEQYGIYVGSSGTDTASLYFF